MYRIRKSFGFSAAHQLRDSYTSLCHESVHGHEFFVEIFIDSDELDDTGMVIDFGKVKNLFGKILKNKWDHSLILPKELESAYEDTPNKRKNIVGYNPTAENFARELYYIFSDIFKKKMKKEKNSRFISLYSVRVWETESGWAEYSETNDRGCSCQK